ncbi:putative colanic acid biosynthesis acetyltransferase [Dyadobacter sp.]|uniref:putative colanic acid biosynthesis acetyltransferase n=1 Tax=Dyadobacter sp. TaxID=1914288 RepID=UPI003F71E9C8
MSNDQDVPPLQSAKNMTEARYKFSTRNKIARVAWKIVYFLLFRPFSLRPFRKWRIFLLRIFGAQVSWSSTISSSVKIWAPWNLAVGDFTCIGPGVDCYNQGRITIGSNVTISQKSYLCASTHDYTSFDHTMIFKPITIEDRVWVAADAFVGPGVTIMEGAVVAARSVISKSVEKWVVVGGNPAKIIKKRELS